MKRPEDQEVDEDLSEGQPLDAELLDAISTKGGGTTTTARRALPERKAMLLKAIANGRSLRQACKIARITRSSVSRWRQADAEFRELYELAAEDGADRIREAIHKRAVQGWSEEVYGKEGLLGHRTLFSDKLLLAMAQARCPEYKPRLDITAVDASDLMRKLRAASARAAETIPPPAEDAQPAQIDEGSAQG